MEFLNLPGGSVEFQCFDAIVVRAQIIVGWMSQGFLSMRGSGSPCLISPGTHHPCHLKICCSANLVGGTGLCILRSGNGGIVSNALTRWLGWSQRTSRWSSKRMRSSFSCRARHVARTSSAILTGASCATTPGDCLMIERITNGTFASSAPGYSGQMCGTGLHINTSLASQKKLQAKFGALVYPEL